MMVKPGSPEVELTGEGKTAVSSAASSQVTAAGKKVRPSWLQARDRHLAAAPRGVGTKALACI